MPSMPRRIVVKGGSGSGKSTVAAELARRLGVRHIEIDALNHGPGWTQATPAELRERLQAALSGLESWIVDGNYESKLGTWLLDRADLIVWLDLPLRLKLRRLWRRTVPRIRSRQPLWNGNVETWRGALWGRESLFAWAIRSHLRNRRLWPPLLAGRNVIRLRSEREVATFLATLTEDRGRN
jgi:adenylate kinase family enzyme